MKFQNWMVLPLMILCVVAFLMFAMREGPAEKAIRVGTVKSAVAAVAPVAARSWKTSAFRYTPIPAAGSPATDTAGTGNVANDLMLSLPARQRMMALAMNVNEGCAATRAFYMGMSPSDHTAFWSVGCDNGESYEVAIEANATGSSRILNCSVLKAVAKVDCFTRLE